MWIYAKNTSNQDVVINSDHLQVVNPDTQEAWVAGIDMPFQLDWLLTPIDDLTDETTVVPAAPGTTALIVELCLDEEGKRTGEFHKTQVDVLAWRIIPEGVTPITTNITGHAADNEIIGVVNRNGGYSVYETDTDDSWEALTHEEFIKTSEEKLLARYNVYTVRA